MNILKLWLLSVIVVPFSLDSAFKIGLGSFSSSLDLAENGESLLKKIKDFQKQDLSDWQGVTIKDNVITYKDALGNVIVTIELPFEYLRLSEKDINELYYVAQNRMIIIEGEERAIVGPLYPCLGVFVTLVDSSKTLVMHVDIGQKSYDVIDPIRKFINQQKVQDLSSVKIFVYMAEETGDLGAGQNVFVNDLLGSLKTAFGASSNIKFDCAEQVLNPAIFKDETGFCVPAYANAPSTLVVRADGTCCNTCLVTEPARYQAEALPALGFTRKDYELIENMSAYVNSMAEVKLMSGPFYSNKNDPLAKFGNSIREREEAVKELKLLMQGEIT